MYENEDSQLHRDPFHSDQDVQKFVDLTEPRRIMTKKRETKKNGETMLTKLKALHDNLRTPDTRNTIPPVEYSQSEAQLRCIKPPNDQIRF